jgi:hypothetical protein
MIDVDPCLFISDKVILLQYVDDCLLFAQKDVDIDEMLEKMDKEQHLVFEQEQSVAGFLGIQIEHKDGYIKMTQKGLIKRIIEALQIEDLPPVATPSDKVLSKDLDGDPPNCAFNYASVVGMIGYLQGNTRPDLSFAHSQCARFTFNPKRSHELALIRIGQYLKHTLNEGMILAPMDPGNFKMDAYVDSDFLGIYGKEDRDDPDNVRSRAGYIICLNDCPIIWSSKLQNNICLSTMMAEYYALSMAMREVLPLRNLVEVVAEGTGLSPECSTSFLTTVWEDNNGALTLAKLDPGQNTARSRAFDVRAHWFRAHLGPQVIVEKIDTKEQLADIFTKPMPRPQFEALRRLMLGW